MITKAQQPLVSSRHAALLLGSAALIGLSLTSLYSYLLFHSLAELFSIVVAFTIFAIMWNSRRFIDNGYLLFLGVSFLFVGAIDVLHSLAYKGMGVFQGYDANLPTQLWIAFRCLLAFSFAVAPFFIKRKVNIARTLAVYSFITFFALTAIFLRKFPDCYIEGFGLTLFKKTSEYLISLIFLVSLVSLYRGRANFNRNVFQLLSWSILLSIAAELCFTQYVSVYGLSNLVGHLFGILSFSLIYRALVVTGIESPYDLVFRNLKQREEELSRAGTNLKNELAERLRIQDSLSKSLIRVEEEKGKTQAILAAMGDAVSIQNADFRVLYQNQVHKDMVGDHAGEYCYKAYGHNDDVCEGCPVALSFEDGKIHRHEKSNMTRKGFAYIDITASPLRDSTGKIIAGIEIVRDMTDRRTAEQTRQVLLEQLQSQAEELRRHRDNLEELIGQRTAELRKLNEELETELVERKAIEKRLRSSKQQLRNLSAHLHAVREEERRSIAREIHDELGQALTALKMDMSWLENKYRMHEPLAEKTKSMVKLVDVTIQTLKKISSELRPVVLDDLGLAAAIEWQATEFQKRSGIGCEVNFVPDDIILDRAISTTIFRIFQEALTNVMRHAGATKVTVSLEERDGEVFLSVQDNGKGITEKQMTDPKSFGLIGMRERVQFFGGEVRITGAQSKGTSVAITIPTGKQESGVAESL